MTKLAQDVLVGRKANGDRVYVTARTTASINPATTVTHQEIPAGQVSIGFSGTVVQKGCQNGVLYGGVLNDLRAVTEPLNGFTADDVADLATIWGRWHLNDLRAACEHMDLPADPSYDARKDITCPETGYRYGSAWLIEPVPAEVVARLEAIFAGAHPQTYRGN